MSPDARRPGPTARSPQISATHDEDQLPPYAEPARLPPVAIRIRAKTQLRNAAPRSKLYEAEAEEQRQAAVGGAR